MRGWVTEAGSISWISNHILPFIHILPLASSGLMGQLKQCGPLNVGLWAAKRCSFSWYLLSWLEADKCLCFILTLTIIQFCIHFTSLIKWYMFYARISIDKTEPILDLIGLNKYWLSWSSSFLFYVLRNTFLRNLLHILPIVNCLIQMQLL